MDTIFDENGLLNIADIVSNHPAYISIMEDGIVTDQELKEQSERAIAALRRIEAICNPEQQAVVLEAISQLSVLSAVYRNYELQNLQN